MYDFQFVLSDSIESQADQKDETSSKKNSNRRKRKAMMWTMNLGIRAKEVSLERD